MTERKLNMECDFWTSWKQAQYEGIAIVVMAVNGFKGKNQARLARATGKTTNNITYRYGFRISLTALMIEMSAMTTTRFGLDNIFIGGVALIATYIRLAVLPR